MRHAKLAIPLVILIAIAGIAFYLVNENSDDLGGITTINSTDTLKDSRTVINDNFNYLEANKLDNADFTGSTGITYTATGTISFDCSEVEGTGIDCSGESITLDATGDWTGTVTGHTGTYNHDNYNTAYSWGNHAGLYLTAGYSALATSTFQPIGSYLTGAYTAVATSTFQPIGSYLTGSYTALATSTFQPIGSYMTAGYSALATSTFVARADWTTIDSYPAACGAGDYVTAIGDTLTCGTPAGSGTVNSSATGTVAYYPGTAASVYGTTTLFIKEDGNVGIGDTTPSAKLDINGGLAVQGTGTSTIAGDLDVADDFEADMAFITTLKGVGTGTSTIAGDLDIADGLEAAIGWFTSALYSVNITISSLLTTVNATITGILKIPSGATQLTSSAGELTIDTTSDQLRYYGTATNTIVKFYTIGFSYATSTWAGTTTLSLAPAMANLTMKGIYCDMAAGTLNMRVGDGTNYMAMLNASTTANYFDFGTTNTTFTAGEEILVDIGTPASSPTRIGCRLKYQYDVD